MKKSKLISLLSTFGKDEMRQFQDFVASPFFNKKEILIPFLDILLKYYPEFEESKVERQRIFGILYPNKAYNEKRLGYLMSYLSQLAERFIGYQKFQSDELMPDYYLMQAYMERKLYKYYLQENRKVKTVVNRQNEISSVFLLKKYLLAATGLKYFNIQLQQKRRRSQNLQNASDSLDLFYITTKLEYSCEMTNQMNVLGADFDKYFTNLFEAQLSDTPFVEEPIVKTYLQIYALLQGELTPKRFETLRQYISENAHNFEIEERQNIYKYVINFCLQMMRKGNMEYMAQAHNLYIDGIKKGIFYENGLLSPWVYTNVIKLGTALKRYDFTKDFIYEYNEKLPKDYRENALHYNLAEIYYSTKDFDKATDHLNQVKFSDIQIHLGSREILAKIYYETDAEEALLSLIASFSIFLKRNKNMSANLKRPYLNFCDLLNQLMRRNPKKLPDIRRKIETTNPVTSRTWLLKTCDEIMEEVGL